MAIYKYTAKKGPEELFEGRIEAQTEEEAVDKLSQMGYVPVRIIMEEQTSKPYQASAGKIKGRIRSRQITIFSRELASLLKAGIPILNALGIISEQSGSPRLKGVVDGIYDRVKQGDSFSSALRNYPNIFSSLYIAMVAAGEDSGALPAALLRIINYRAKQEAMVSRLRMALVYPALMAVVGLGTVVFMLTFVMPRLMQIFLNMGQDLPLPTQILIFLSQWLRKWWIAISLGLIGFIVIIRQQVKTKIGKVTFSLFKLHLPIFGKLILKAELSRFCRTMELLINNGIPILRAISIAIPVLENEIIKNKLKQSYKDLEQGGSFGRSLKTSKLFPLFMTNLISVGEESGSLDDSLGEVATSYEEDTDEAMKVMSSLLEPLMILIMGSIVGFMVVAMLLPIFEINIIAS